MVAPLLLLASFIIPSALQQQTETVDQKLVAISEWLGEWRTYSSDAQVQLADNQVETGTKLDKVVAEAVNRARDEGETRRAVVESVDDAWEVSLLKLAVDTARRSAGGNMEEWKRRGLL